MPSLDSLSRKPFSERSNPINCASNRIPANQTCKNGHLYSTQVAVYFLSPHTAQISRAAFFSPRAAKSHARRVHSLSSLGAHEWGGASHLARIRNGEFFACPCTANVLCSIRFIYNSCRRMCVCVCLYMYERTAPSILKAARGSSARIIYIIYTTRHRLHWVTVFSSFERH